MDYKYGYTIDELIEELETIKLNIGTGDVEVMLTQLSDNDVEWNAHISAVETEGNDLGETIVKVY